MPAQSGQPKAYYNIYNNIKNQWERTGKINNKKYDRWEGLADQRAHMIALSYIKNRYNKKARTNQELLDELEYFHKKNKELELKKSFEHPDYKHVHNKEY